jgi:cell division septum initiation protein DivIVA
MKVRIDIPDDVLDDVAKKRIAQLKSENEKLVERINNLEIELAKREQIYARK